MVKWIADYTILSCLSAEDTEEDACAKNAKTLLAVFYRDV